MTDPDLARSISANIEAVRSRVERAAREAGRLPEHIRLIAVSKTFSAEHIRAAAAAGQRDFGENRIQEALTKMDALRDLPLRWHLIGHLQSNKARKSVGPFELIHSVDGLDLLQRLDALAGAARTKIDVLLQTDLAGETTKFGASSSELERMLEAASSLAGVRVRGLMLLPPFSDDPEAGRPYFRRLRELRDELVRRGVAGDGLVELSMGMSHDFEVAIAEGATMVRVGTAIFGARPPRGA